MNTISLKDYDLGVYLSEILITGIIGVEWDQSRDTWSRIDEYGNKIQMPAAFFDAHPTWGGMRRCTLSAAGTVNHYGANPRGDGLTLNGTDGRVMVEIPKFYVKSQSPSANVYRWWISPSLRPGFELHPAFVQRGGVEKDHIYVGAYNADFQYDGDNEVYDAGHEKLHSRTGKQPYTGVNDCFFSIPVDDLGTEPAIGDLVSTPTDGSFYIVDYVKTAGAWAGGTAGDTATIWLRKPGQATCGMANGEVLTNDTTTTTIGNTTAADTPRNVTLGHSRTLAGNIGAGWGLLNIWSLSAVQLLFYTEYAGADLQTKVGKGIVDKAAGAGFAGENSGALSADSNIGVNGTGTGTGTNGLTPIAYRGIENLWGNIWQFIDGWNAVDAEYRLVNRDGTGTLADTLTGGNYEASTGIPITTDGYISNILYEDLTKYAFIASAVLGSSGTYLYDYWYAHDTGETNILLAGGRWIDGATAGVGCRNADLVAAGAARTIGSRLEFIG